VNPLRSNVSVEKGFTLIEVMITMVVAMVILGGLLLSFLSQNSEYKYQNSRINTVQDLEFGLKFIAEDLRSALVGGQDVNIVNAASPYATTVFDFYVWSTEDASSANGRAHRKYEFSNDASHILKYDREINPTDNPAEILTHVTFFKVFNDGDSGVAEHDRGGFSGMPSALADISLADPAGTVAGYPGYTILIEIEVDASSKHGSLVDVRDQPTTTKRVWRYAQVYPMSAVQ
jgi:Tfp pilus assembly protein PilV